MKELLMIALIPARFRLSSTKPIFASFVFLFCCNAIRADDPPKAASKATLTNDDVKRLLEIHISEDQILQAIQKNDGTFNISKDAITQLKTTGLTANIARAMEDANKRKLQQDQDA